MIAVGADMFFSTSARATTAPAAASAMMPVALPPDFGFDLEFRTDGLGRKYLWFPAMFLPDLHIGGGFCKAELVCRLLEYVEVDMLVQQGDAIGGKELREKSTHGKNIFTRLEKQILAHLFRKKEMGTEVIGIQSNHDVELQGAPALEEGKPVVRDGRTLLHGELKKLFGIPFVKQFVYTDGQTRRWLIHHGDFFRNIAFGPEEKPDAAVPLKARAGDMLLLWMSNLDSVCRHVPGLSHFSIVAAAKDRLRPLTFRIRGFKTTFGHGGIVARTVDAMPNIDASLSADSHEKGTAETLGGKEIVDAGSCTERVEWDAFDKKGRRAHFILFRKGLFVKPEKAPGRMLSWKALDWNPFLRPLTIFPDDHRNMMQARHAERLAKRIWAPRKHRNEIARIRKSGLTREEQLDIQPSLHLPEHPRSAEQTARKEAFLRKRNRLAQPVAA